MTSGVRQTLYERPNLFIKKDEANSMGKICLVRHGETDWNKLTKLQGWTDIPLNETGKNQAIKVGEYLKQYEWNRIISSPLKRARYTAEIIADINGIDEVETSEQLIERYYGLAEGMTLEERLNKYPTRNYENMEVWEVLRNRMISTVEQYAKDNQNQNLIMVSHGSAINAILHTLSEGKYGSGVTKLHMGSLNMLVYEEGSLRIEFYNMKAY